MTVLVTGCAGFVGAHVAMKLLAMGREVIGLDNVNDYYDASLKESRLALFKANQHFTFYLGDIAERSTLDDIFNKHKLTHVVNLAAQPGVRYSLEHPEVYIKTNILGFSNILECARLHKVEHLVFSSSSSVYGANAKQPFSEHDGADHPISLYGATKKTNEVLAHSYASAHGLSCTGLRFFTVYGPWGRPDMALFTFTRKMLAGEEIDVYNDGNMVRDFTYIDDVVDGVLGVLDKPAQANAEWDALNPDPASSAAPYRLYNVGRGQSVKLMDFISALEDTLNIKAKKRMLPLQLGDVVATEADVSMLADVIGKSPSVSVLEGVTRFVKWYKSYYEK